MSNELDLFASAGDGLNPKHFGIDEHGRAFVEAPAFGRAMQYSSTQKALQIVDEDEKGQLLRLTPGGQQLIWVIYEDGIWELIFRSTLPYAKAIKARVKAILRELRETGVVDTRDAGIVMPTDYETALEHLLASVRERKVLAARNAELEDAAEGYRHFIETDGTVKWRNACEHLGVAPNLFGAYLRDQKVLFTGGERHNRPYAQYAHWFAFPAYEAKDPEKLERVPESQRYDRRVTDPGMDGLRRALKRHVVGCGDCTMCKSIRLAKPEIFASWRCSPLAVRGEAS